ncbi:MAG: hypothetical protein V7K89_00025 [Nostoc sp.]|uniref:hypothetical protein n=1 Tax=Nostoc sp. TaxID=1180 RepID=UPI002FF4BBFE
MTQIKIDNLQEYINLSDDETQNVIGGYKKPKIIKPRPKFYQIVEVIIDCPAAIPATENPSTTTENPSTTT